MFVSDYFNCTPHTIIFCSEDGKRVTFRLPPSGYVVRIETPPQEIVRHEILWEDQGGPDSWVPVVRPQDFRAGKVTGLPPSVCPVPLEIGGPAAPYPSQAYSAALPYWHAWRQGKAPAIIVGIIGAEAVAAAWPGPVYATDTGPESVVRDNEGRILGIRRLQLISGEK